MQEFFRFLPVADGMAVERSTCPALPSSCHSDPPRRQTCGSAVEAYRSALLVPRRRVSGNRHRRVDQPRDGAGGHRPQAARRRNGLFDINGLLVTSRTEPR
jgi:hypothetical protein